MAGNARCHIQGPLRGELAFWVVYSVGLSVGVGVGVFISRYGEFFLVGDFRPTWLEGGTFFFFGSSPYIPVPTGTVPFISVLNSD